MNINLKLVIKKSEDMGVALNLRLTTPLLLKIPNQEKWDITKSLRFSHDLISSISQNQGLLLPLKTLF